MGLTVSDYGFKSHNGNQSRWLAAHSPCPITFHRKDATSASIGVSSVLAMVVPEDVWDEAEIGDQCYINTADGAYDGIFEITGMVEGPPGTYVLSFNDVVNRKAQWAYDSSESNHVVASYLNLLKRDYVIELEVLRVDLNPFQSEQFTNDGGDWNVFGGYAAGDNIGRSALTDYRFKFTTPPNGIFKFDLSEIMSTYIDLQHLYNANVDINRTSGNPVQPNKMMVALKYRQNWSALPQPVDVGGENEFTIDINNLLVFINGVRQNNSLYGSNLAEYVLHDVVNTGKFLTPFDEPTYFVGYPFFLSFLTESEGALGGGSDNFAVIINEYNINGTLLATTISDDIQLEPSELRHIDITEIYTSINANTHYFTVAVMKNLGEDSYDTRLPAKKCKLQRNCGANQKAIIWKNSLGGESTWVFSYNQDIQLDNRDKISRMSVYQEHITVNEWECLQEICNGGELVTSSLTSLLDEYDEPIKGRRQRTGFYAYLIDPSQPGELRTIVVERQANDYRTRQSKTSIGFTFEYKETYMQQ